jgi:hypothetical protein
VCPNKPHDVHRIVHDRAFAPPSGRQARAALAA